MSRIKNIIRQAGQDTILVSILIFFFVFLPFMLSKPVVSDSRFAIQTSISIIREHNTDLDEYMGLLKEQRFYETEWVGDHIYSKFPVGASLSALPVVLLLEVATDTNDSAGPVIQTATDHFTAAVIAAASTVLIYLIAMLFFARKRYGLLLAFIFGFCTSVWSTASLALWQHGPSMLMLALTLYLLLLARDRPSLARFAGIPLAFSYVTRPTNSISVLLLSFYIFWQFRKYFPGFLLGAMTVAVPFLLFSLKVYGAILPPYYDTHKLGFGNLPVALAGNLISPARGLLIFSPVIVFSVVGLVVKIRRRQFDLLDGCLVAIILLHWLSISSFEAEWWAGHSFGPRLFSDMTPYLVYFMIPAVTMITGMRFRPRVAVSVIFAVLVCFSFFVHLRGATSIPVQTWNNQPEVFHHQERIWDWRDLSFLRGL
ncbi:MAG: hypothetical protein ACYCXF_06015 [Thermoleophilia bacterium]